MKDWVCFITSVHQVFDVRIFHKEERTLKRSGYRLTLIGPHEKEEIVDGIRILPLTKPKGRLERMTKEAEAMGRRGRKAVLERYNWSHEAAQILACYQRIFS